MCKMEDQSLVLLALHLRVPVSEAHFDGDGWKLLTLYYREKVVPYKLLFG